MKDWFNGLAPRERVMSGAAAAVVALVLIYAAAWSPLSAAVARLQQSVEEQRALKQWMQQAAAEAGRLRGAAGIADRRSLLAVVDQTSKQSQLAPAVKRIEPDGQDSVRVSLEQASFDDLVLWLGDLQHGAGVGVADLSVDRQADAGRVNARLTLKRAGQ